MAHYIEDFSTGITGQPYPGFSIKISRAGDSATVNSDITHGKFLNIMKGGTAGSLAVGWDVLNGKQDVELLMKFRTGGASPTSGRYGILYGRYDGNSEASTRGYSATFTPVGASKPAIIINEDSYGTIHYTEYTWENNQIYWARLRVEGTNQYFRIWKDGDTEPIPWTLSGAYTGPSIAYPYSGIGNFSAWSNIQAFQISAATDGGLALPYDPLNTGPTRDITYSDIIQDPTSNFTTGRTLAVSDIAIHWWGDPALRPTMTGVRNHFKNPASEVSAHFVVSGNTIYQMVDLDDTAWHVLGNNAYTIGIEIDPSTPPGTYETVAGLVRYINASVGRKLGIKGHNSFPGNGSTQCPGEVVVQKIIDMADIPPTYSNGYENRRKLTVNASKVSASESGYVSLVELSGSYIKSRDNGGKVHLNPLLDVRFETASGVKLSHEVELYDGVAGKLLAWVKLPTISNATEIYAYYGKDLEASTSDDLDSWTSSGIRVGYGSSDLTIERNWYNGGANVGELMSYSSYMIGPDGQTLEQRSELGDTAMSEAGSTEYYCYLMYHTHATAGRFSSTANKRDNFVAVWQSGSQWKYDNNNNSWVNFTPNSDDLLVARLKAGSTSGVVFASPLRAGEEEVLRVWEWNNDRLAMHMHYTPDNTAATKEQLDSSWRSNTGSAYGNQNASNLVDGKIGKAISLDGNDDRLHIENDTSLQVTGDLTLSLWVYPRSSGTRKILIGKAYGGEYELIYNADRSVQFYWGTSGDNSGTYQNHTSFGSLELNKWNHVAVSRELGSGGFVRFYINGSMIRQDVPQFSAAKVSIHPVSMGWGRVDSYFDGILDEVSIRSTARSSSWINTEYNNQDSPLTFWSRGDEETPYTIESTQQYGDARIQRTESTVTAGDARIQRNESTTTTGDARIQRTESLGQTGNARIRRTFNKTQVGQSRITRVENVQQTGSAEIESFYFSDQVTQTGNARIELVKGTTQVGESRIERINSTTQAGSAFIEWQKQQDQVGDAFIIWQKQVDQSGDAFIEQAKQVRQYGDAFIEYQNEISQPGEARIEKTLRRTQTGRAQIIRIDTLDQPGDARIERQEQLAITGNAKIINPTPEKLPQRWDSTGDKPTGQWGDTEKQAQEWGDNSTKTEAAWQDTDDKQSQQWSDGDSGAPAEWRRTFYD